MSTNTSSTTPVRTPLMPARHDATSRRSFLGTAIVFGAGLALGARAALAGTLPDPAARAPIAGPLTPAELDAYCAYMDAVLDEAGRLCRAAGRSPIDAVAMTWDHMFVACAHPVLALGAPVLALGSDDPYTWPEAHRLVREFSAERADDVVSRAEQVVRTWGQRRQAQEVSVVNRLG